MLWTSGGPQCRHLLIFDGFLKDIRSHFHHKLRRTAKIKAQRGYSVDTKERTVFRSCLSCTARMLFRVTEASSVWMHWIVHLSWPQSIFLFCRFFILPQTQTFLFLSLSLDLDPEGPAPSACPRAPGSPEGGTRRAWQSLTVSVQGGAFLILALTLTSPLW